MSTTKTISTPEEVIYTPEDTLPAVSAAQVKQLRALNTNDESVNVSPDELAKTNVRPTRNYVTDGATERSGEPYFTFTLKPSNIGLQVGDPIMYQMEYLIADNAAFTLKISRRAETNYDIRNKWAKAFVTTKVTAEDIATDSIDFCIWFHFNLSVRKVRNIFIGIGNQSVDWFPAVGVDYSLLTEQAVPGEFFVNRQGEKRQVYTRTVVFEYTTQWYSLFAGASLIMSYSLNDLGTALDGAVAARNIPAPEIYVLTNGTVQIVIGAEQLGRYYAIHLKYTKQ